MNHGEEGAGGVCGAAVNHVICDLKRGLAQTNFSHC
jgi:hypothetical protein